MNSFGFKRIKALLVKHYTEHMTRYMVSILILFGVLLCNAAFSNHFPEVMGQENFYFYKQIAWLAYLAWMIVVVNLSIKDFKQRKQMILAYALPASTMEKITFIFIRTVVLGTIEFMMLTLVVHTISNLIWGEVTLSFQGVWTHFYGHWYKIESVLLIQSCVLAACLESQKSGRTKLGIFLGIITGLFLSHLICKISWEGVSLTSILPLPKTVISFEGNGDTLLTIHHLGFSHQWIVFLKDLVILLTIVVLWTIAGFAIKENETK